MAKHQFLKSITSSPMFLRLYNNLFPKGILARFALIICAPVIISQLVTIYLFYDKVWFNVNCQTSNMLSHEINLVITEHNKGDKINLRKFNKLFNFKLEETKENLPHPPINKRTELQILTATLQKDFSNFIELSHNLDANTVSIYFREDNGKMLKITMPSKPLLNPTAEIFIFWILGISCLFIFIALLFAKNQIRSIEELANAANSFGSSLKNKIQFKPSGAAEIRRAGIAFVRMQDRLEKQVQKRLQMLALISHDLRTPLTRMILHLELMENSEDHEMLKHDLDSMKHMIDSYLDFARGEASEQYTLTELNEYLTKFFQRSSFAKTKLVLEDKPIYAKIRPLSFARALTNLVSNAEKYANNAELRCIQKDGKVLFIVEDDGPGIAEEEKNLVFKAFYRSDKARGIDKFGSVGLGLPIAKEIVLSHKGEIAVEDSKRLGGAEITVSIDVAKEGETLKPDAAKKLQKN